jgi:PBP1b-binding outer membrane lipoprotein LpoB
MKRALLILTLAVAVVSCNNDGASTDNVQDSVINTIDSSADAKIDSIQETTDSVKQRLENSFEKTDSANQATADTAAQK